MKRISIVALLIILIVSLTVLTACSSIPKDQETAKQKLEDAGYSVTVYEHTAAASRVYAATLASLKLGSIGGIYKVLIATKLDENSKLIQIHLVYADNNKSPKALCKALQKKTEEELQGIITAPLIKVGGEEVSFDASGLYFAYSGKVFLASNSEVAAKEVF